MLKLSYDLHIHSCLSPCGDEDMTPANIVAMAKLKGLDVIAVTDHNSCKNCAPVLKWADEYNITAIPGMELTTREEVHVLCLFTELSDAMNFDAYVYEKLIKIPNNEIVFGSQDICDAEDNITGQEQNLLINATTINFNELDKLMEDFRGIYIPAHIDKNSNSLLYNLGFIPEKAHFKAAELADVTKLEELAKPNPYLLKCGIITDSDAHYLGNINEACNFLHCKSRSRQEVIRALSGLEC
jgi:PHP family Zn ribbon phosphoesterase